MRCEIQAQRWTIIVQTAEQASEMLDFVRTKLDCCLVIDGESLQVGRNRSSSEFTDANFPSQLCLDKHKTTFINIATQLPVVVACRCSPTQKADVARLIREYTKKRVCCIGDGGNDVSMIQAADVGECQSDRKVVLQRKKILSCQSFAGVGIVGKEGKQASLAADFSINQFSHLTKLLLWHGRNSYKRSAKLAQFVIHRGLIISTIQAVFSSIFFFARESRGLLLAMLLRKRLLIAYMSAFLAIALYQGWLQVGYATLYTMAPVFSLVLDQDVNEDLALLYPELYKELTLVSACNICTERTGNADMFLTQGRTLSTKTFFIWLMISIYQGESDNVPRKNPPTDVQNVQNHQ